jgi:hypothetical protein
MGQQLYIWQSVLAKHLTGPFAQVVETMLNELESAYQVQPTGTTLGQSVIQLGENLLSNSRPAWQRRKLDTEIWEACNITDMLYSIYSDYQWRRKPSEVELEAEAHAARVAELLNVATILTEWATLAQAGMDPKVRYLWRDRMYPTWRPLQQLSYSPCCEYRRIPEHLMPIVTKHRSVLVRLSTGVSQYPDIYMTELQNGFATDDISTYVSDDITDAHVFDAWDLDGILTVDMVANLVDGLVLIHGLNDLTRPSIGISIVEDGDHGIVTEVLRPAQPYTWGWHDGDTTYGISPLGLTHDATQWTHLHSLYQLRESLNSCNVITTPANASLVIIPLEI